MMMNKSSAVISQIYFKIKVYNKSINIGMCIGDKEITTNTKLNCGNKFISIFPIDTTLETKCSNGLVVYNP